MIHLTRLNNRPLVVNADLIKFIENAPDTVITLLTGDKLVVRESVDEVLQRVREYHIQSPRGIAFTLPAKLSMSEGNSAAAKNLPGAPRAEEEEP
jgi:flagellar protein FlbD